MIDEGIIWEDMTNTLSTFYSFWLFFGFACLVGKFGNLNMGRLIGMWFVLLTLASAVFGWIAFISILADAMSLWALHWIEPPQNEWSAVIVSVFAYGLGVGLLVVGLKRGIQWLIRSARKGQVVS